MKEMTCLMKNIQEAEFDLIETALYLDVYPESKQALEHFYEVRNTLDRMTDEYERKYGPLTFKANNARTWNWTDLPWPWEYEVN